jgi:uncharacterized protein YndB with AHSA1/START domain
MAQKIKNQKNNKKSLKAKPAQKAGKSATRSVKASSPKAKAVKKVKKSAPPPSKKSNKPLAKKSVSPAKAVKAPAKTGKPVAKPVIQKTNVKKPITKAAPAPKTAAASSAKGKKEAVLAVTQPTPVDKKLLPTIKRPGAGQVQQRRNPAKQQKKVYRTELIFPNQLKETPLLKPKNKPEPKGKFVLEFLVKSSPTLLFDFLSTPSGLSEWFADDVDIRSEEFTFHWDGQVQRARLLAYKQDHLLRLRWNDKNEDFYFEFRIDVDDLTGDVTLIVTDFGESEDDVRTSRLLWESQINKLLKVLGAY